MIIFAFAACFSTAHAHASFVLEAEPGAFEPKSRIVVYRQDIDDRATYQILESKAAADGSLALRVNEEAGLYKVDAAGFEGIDIAPAADETVELSSKGGQLIASGSPGTNLLRRYETLRKDSLARLVYPARNDIKKAKARFAADDEIARLTQIEVDAYQEHLRELNDFVIEEIGDSVALYATSLRWNADYRGESLASLVERFAQRHGDIAATRSMRHRIRTALDVAIGSVAPSLEAETLNGETVSLSDFRGRYVLVDFWASWCPPCRVENRHYRELTAKLDPSEFTIFAVSLDNAERLWEQAVKRDKADWIQVSDLEGWNSPLAASYGVASLPASFLLNPKGEIVAKNLRGPALDAELAKLGLL